MKKSEQGRRGKALIGVALLSALITTGASAVERVPMIMGFGDVPVHARGTEVTRIAQLAIQAVPYRWAAEKSDDGTIVINGYAPNAELQSQLHTAAGAHALDASSIAGGEPEEFSSNALTALTILLALDTGKVALTANSWQVSGQTGNATASTYVERLVSESSLVDAGWQVEIAYEQSIAAEDETIADSADAADDVVTLGDDTKASGVVVEPAMELDAEEVPEELIAAEEVWEAVPEIPEVNEPKPVQPFGFAVRTLGDKWLVGGNAPSAAFQRYLELHFDVKTRGELAVSQAPDGFVLTAMAGMEALAALESGALLYSDGDWHLSGIAESADMAGALTASLAAADIGADPKQLRPGEHRRNGNHRPCRLPSLTSGRLT